MLCGRCRKGKKRGGESPKKKSDRGSVEQNRRRMRAAYKILRQKGAGSWNGFHVKKKKRTNERKGVKTRGREVDKDSFEGTCAIEGGELTGPKINSSEESRRGETKRESEERPFWGRTHVISRGSRWGGRKESLSLVLWLGGKGDLSRNAECRMSASVHRT